jgi:hypothetical protein
MNKKEINLIASMDELTTYISLINDLSLMFRLRCNTRLHGSLVGLVNFEKPHPKLCTHQRLRQFARKIV